MPQAGFEPMTSWLQALVHSATQIPALQEWKLEFIKMFNDKHFLISADRSLLSYCTVLFSLWASVVRGASIGA